MADYWKRKSGELWKDWSQRIEKDVIPRFRDSVRAAQNRGSDTVCVSALWSLLHDVEAFERDVGAMLAGARMRHHREFGEACMKLHNALIAAQGQPIPEQHIYAAPGMHGMDAANEAFRLAAIDFPRERSIEIGHWDQDLTTHDELHDWLLDNMETNGPALRVVFTNDEGTPCFMIGARWTADGKRAPKTPKAPVEPDRFAKYRDEALF